MSRDRHAGRGGAPKYLLAPRVIIGGSWELVARVYTALDLLAEPTRLDLPGPGRELFGGRVSASGSIDSALSQCAGTSLDARTSRDIVGVVKIIELPANETTDWT